MASVFETPLQHKIFYTMFSSYATPLWVPFETIEDMDYQGFDPENIAVRQERLQLFYS